jgi:ribosomal protein L11 methyltransferase
MKDPDQHSAWIQISVRVDKERVESAESVLFETGAVSVTLLDAEDHPVHEPGPGEMPLWPDVVVQGLFQAEIETTAVIRALERAGLVDDPTRIQREELVNRDWERAWMDQYQPMAFGNELWICPSHIEPDPEWPLVIRLDPGLAFGSGTHPTTALCLEWIDSLDLADRTVIDFGCGSGILAIACALKGAREVIAVDHDPQALQATSDNARRNGCEDLIDCLDPGQFKAQTVDCVVANILAGPLIKLAPVLQSCVADGGQLILSGILRDQADAVIRAYQPELRLADHSAREDWVRLVFYSA